MAGSRGSCGAMRGALPVAARAGTRQPRGRRHSLLELLQFSSFSKQFQFSSFSSSTGVCCAGSNLQEPLGGAEVHASARRSTRMFGHGNLFLYGFHRRMASATLPASRILSSRSSSLMHPVNAVGQDSIDSIATTSQPSKPAKHAPKNGSRPSAPTDSL